MSKTGNIPAEPQGSREHRWKPQRGTHYGLGRTTCPLFLYPTLITAIISLRRQGNCRPPVFCPFTLTWLKAVLHFMVNTILQRLTRSHPWCLKFPQCLPIALRRDFKLLTRSCAILPWLVSMILSPVTIPLIFPVPATHLLGWSLNIPIQGGSYRKRQSLLLWVAVCPFLKRNSSPNPSSSEWLLIWKRGLCRCD